MSNVDNYIDQGGSASHIGGTLDIESGGTLTVKSGGTLDLESGTVNVPTVADANVIGGIPVVHRIAIADGAGDTDVVLTHKTLVTDVVVVKTAANGGAGDTVTIKNGANAITDAIDLNINDTIIARAGSIDDAYHEIAAGGDLTVTAANATNNACIVYVHGLRVA